MRKSRSVTTPDALARALTAVELRHLRYFVAVAEELHFGRAAQRLGLAQPPLSQQIDKLERAIGERLFDRKPRVRLTAAGEALFPAAREILANVAESIGAARRAGRGVTGRLTVGFASSILPGHFPIALRAHREQFPAVELRLRELASAAQSDALRRGIIDVGVMREPAHDDDLASETLVEESFAVALPQRHPLADQSQLSIASLADEPFVHFPREVAPALHDRVIAMCVAAGFTPRIVQEAHEWLTIVGLVDAGLGVAIVPRSFQALRWGNVRYVPIDDIDYGRTPVVVSWLAERESSVVTNFVALVRDAFRYPERIG